MAALLSVEGEGFSPVHMSAFLCLCTSPAPSSPGRALLWCPGMVQGLFSRVPPLGRGWASSAQPLDINLVPGSSPRPRMPTWPLVVTWTIGIDTDPFCCIRAKDQAVALSCSKGQDFTMTSGDRAGCSHSTPPLVLSFQFCLFSQCSNHPASASLLSLHHTPAHGSGAHGSGVDFA